jgi:hypothetical protein
VAGLPAEVLADQSGDADQGLSDRATLAFDVGHGSGEKTPDALVPTGGQAHGQLSRRPTEELGRSTCVRFPPPRRAAKLALEEPVIDQLFEMELGDVMATADPEAASSRLTASGCNSTKQYKDQRSGSADAAMPVTCASNSSECDDTSMGTGRSRPIAPSF